MIFIPESDRYSTLFLIHFQNAMNTCPCCSEQLLRHARNNNIYWFCPRCWQEMPNFSIGIINEHKPKKTLNQISSDLRLVQ